MHCRADGCWGANGSIRVSDCFHCSYVPRLPCQVSDASNYELSTLSFICALMLLQMYMSAYASWPVMQARTPFERAVREKNHVDVFVQPNATMGWKARTKGGRQEPPAVQLTRKAGKVAVYATTQMHAATATDDLCCFTSTLLPQLFCYVCCAVCDS